MVWLIIALPVAAIVAGLVTVWIAFREADALVKEGHYKVGFAVHQGDPLVYRATQLGIRAELKATGSELQVRLQGRYAEPPRRLILTLGGSATEPTIRMEAAASGPARYRTPWPPLPAGSRALVVEPDDRTWRITGQWQTPSSATLLLAGDAQSPPSKP